LRWWRERTELVFSAQIASAEPITILEDPDAEASRPQLEGSSLTFDLGPFAVSSFRVRFA